MSSFNGNIAYISVYMADVGAPSSAYVPVPADVQGEVVSVSSTYSAALTGANAVVTVKADTVTVGTHTIAFSGSAAGVVTTTAHSGFAVKGGGLIELATDGGPTNAGAVPAWFVVGIRR